MTSRIIGRLCSAFILGMILTLLVHHDYTSRSKLTRDEYLAQQSQRYDKHIAKPASFPVTFIASFVLLGAVIGGYELVAFGVSKVVQLAGNQE